MTRNGKADAAALMRYTRRVVRRIHRLAGHFYVMSEREGSAVITLDRRIADRASVYVKGDFCRVEIVLDPDATEALLRALIAYRGGPW